MMRLAVDVTTPTGWHPAGAGTTYRGRAWVALAAVSPTHWAVGFELLTRDKIGVALILGPLWLGVATAKLNRTPQPALRRGQGETGRAIPPLARPVDNQKDER
ncbi:hypothetical protein [uncultured Sphingomonas sp.]|uniref:hypothetical protein n=1 Tax=uncultured Sphingomonas sp. TaxID=158754 RepID=UPI0025FB14A8|nr:hypothetical protein [uncultured Sphingomonas sp.]